MTTKDYLEEYQQLVRETTPDINHNPNDCEDCKMFKKRMEEIIQELEASIRKEVLEELYQRNRNHEPSEATETMFRDDLEKLTYICGRVDVVNNIKEYASSKGITLE